ncbi:hypothetical protein Leryth_023596 [Lithospermum erythrorhizon]|nr:hypothetical protein Leryth_023596 [Lithospermum erythrorhizon]
MVWEPYWRKITHCENHTRRILLRLRGEDAMNFMKKCDICERMGSVQHKPTPSMTPIPKPIPLAMWGINLVNCLEGNEPRVCSSNEVGLG